MILCGSKEDQQGLWKKPNNTRVKGGEFSARTNLKGCTIAALNIQAQFTWTYSAYNPQVIVSVPLHRLHNDVFSTELCPCLTLLVSATIKFSSESCCFSCFCILCVHVKCYKSRSKSVPNHCCRLNFCIICFSQAQVLS